MSGSDLPVPAGGPDLRLLLPAVAGWAAVFWADAQTPSPVASMAVLAGGAAVGSAAVLLRAGSGAPAVAGGPTAAGAGTGDRVRHCWTPLVAAGALTLAVVTGLLAGTAFRLAGRSAGPLPGWIAGRAVAELDGQAVSDPRAVAAGRFPGPARVAVRMRVHRAAVGGAVTTGSVTMLVLAPAGSWGAVTAGQQVRFRGRLSGTDPGDAPVALVSVHGAPQGVVEGGWPWRFADRVRAGLREACRGLDPDSAGLLPSLVVGDTSALPSGLEADLKSAGLTHLTAVSGANVAIVVAAITWLVSCLGAPRWVRLTVSVLGVAGFVVLARPSPSVLRAAVMASVALIGLAGARRSRGVPVLATSVILLLAYDPWLARDPGFALSVVATGGLLLLAPVWAGRLARRMPRALAVALAAPAAAQAACGPVLLLLAPSVSLMAVPANLLAEPAVAPATLLGVVAAVASQLWPGAAHLVAWFGSLATNWIAVVAHRGARMPLAEMPWPGGAGGAVLLAGLTAVLIRVTVRAPAAGGLLPDTDRATQTGPVLTGPVLAGPVLTGPVLTGPVLTGPARGRCRGRRRPPGRSAVFLVVAAVGAAVAGWLVPVAAGGWLPLPGRGVPAGWGAVMCDVGQGDALVLRSGRDRALLVDAGPEPAAIDGCLRRLGIRHLDLVVITHLHADHAFGLPGALNGRDVAALWVSPLAEPVHTAHAVARWAAAGGAHPVRVRAGARGSSGHDGWAARWRVLEPLVPPGGVGEAGDADQTAVNESSVVLLIEVEGPSGRLRVLDLGDLETGRQRGLAERLRSGVDTLTGPVDVVKVAHHGSSRQWPGLYGLSGARIGLIGVGSGNAYGHPAAAALDLLRHRGIRVARTDLGGDLVLECTRDGLRVTALGGRLE